MNRAARRSLVRGLNLQLRVALRISRTQESPSVPRGLRVERAEATGGASVRAGSLRLHLRGSRGVKSIPALTGR